MNQHPIALALALLFAASVPLSGCDRISSLTEQEYIQRAKDFEEKGDLKSSIVELKNAIQKSPGSPQARLLLGQIYLKVGMGAEAEKELSQAEKLGVNRELTKPQLGEALLLMGEYKRVLDEIEPGQQTSKPNLARIFQLRADALLKLGQLKDACSLYQQSLDADRSNPATYWGLAQCAVAERDMTKARKWLDEALKIKDKQSKTWIFIGDLEKLNDHSENALSAYTSALKSDPDNLEALQNRATLNINLDQTKLARVDIKRIQNLAPKSLSASYLQALLKFEEKELPEARNALQKAFQIAPNHLPSLLLGSAIEYELGNLQGAESHIRKVLRSAPRNANALRLLATIQLRQGRVEDAARTLAPTDLEKTSDPGVHALAGEIALAKRDFTKAAAHFETAAKLSPNSAAIRSELGMARLAQGDPRAAADLQAASNMEGTRTTLDKIIILNQLSQKQYDASLASIAALEKKQPSNPLSWHYRGVAYMGKKDVAKARDSFMQSLRLDSKFLPAAISLAQMDLADGQISRARKRVEDIVKSEPGHLQAMLVLAQIEKMSGNKQQYLQWLDTAIKIRPRAIAPRQLLVAHYVETGQVPKALALANATLIAMPNNPYARMLLVDAQIAAGEVGNATSTSKRLVETQPQLPDAYFTLAKALSLKNDAGAVGRALEQVLKLEPQHPAAKMALARLRLAEKKYDVAAPLIASIMKEHPEDANGYLLESALWASKGDLPRAANVLERGRVVLPKSEDLLFALAKVYGMQDSRKAIALVSSFQSTNPGHLPALLYLAEAYGSAGDKPEAIKQYRRAVQVAPDNPIVLNNLASYLVEQNPAEALAYAKRAYLAAPKNPMIMDTYGWALLQQGQTEEALRFIGAAVKMRPKHTGIRYHHIVTLVKAGQTKEAKRQAHRLLENSENFPEKNQLQALISKL